MFTPFSPCSLKVRLLPKHACLRDRKRVVVFRVVAVARAIFKSTTSSLAHPLDLTTVVAVERVDATERVVEMRLLERL